jgi:TolB-like protein/DNA-binding winged helix-turn-helix (wHTH) protein/tetratricopeptide (TPR) repeat protein
MGLPRINLAETSDFDLGALRVSPARRLVSMAGEYHELEPKVVQVLVALASARPQVVSRDRLIQQCWDGRIVGDDALNRCIVALRQLARQFSPEPFAIETVTRVGYCLVEGATATLARGRSWRSVRPAMAAILLLLVVLATALAIAVPRLGRTDVAPASIAVLPFRNLSAGDPYFAEGIGEEILGQLAREPQFRVAGGMSSVQFAADSDFKDVARRLNVNYVLEGSVRRQGHQVRVNADLVRASDGMRLWSDTYDGKLDDIFSIQRRIGIAIAGALQRKLIQAPTLSGPLVTNGEAYNLYLTARGLIRTRNRNVFVTSSNLLRDAIQLDPNYAPAWASLAESTYLEDYPNGSDGMIAALPRAKGYAGRALQLAPDLADAHRVLALLLPYGSPEALSHFRRAVELDPNSAEALLGLGSGLGAAGQFDAEMSAYRRARALDSAWFRTTGQLAIRLAETGKRTEAEAIAKSGFADNQPNLHILLGRIAWIFGDFSEAARHWSITARSNSPRWSQRAQTGVADVKMIVGIDPTPAGYRPSFTNIHQKSDVHATAPTPAAWQIRNRNAEAADAYRDDNDVAAKLMLIAGRAQEVAGEFDKPWGLLSLRPNAPVRADQLHEAAVVALALRRAGRSAAADRLLRQADARVDTVYRQRTIPFALDADVAMIRAVEGDPDQALSMLERAVRRGWTSSANTDLRDLEDEPALASLRGQPRFERIRASLAAHLARERMETAELRL